MTPWSTFPVVEELIREQTHPSMEKWIGWMLSVATAPTVSSLPILQRLSRLGRAGWWSQCPSIAVASDGNRFVQGVRGNRRCSQSQDWKGFCVHPRLGTGNGNGGETSALFQSLTRRPETPRNGLSGPSQFVSAAHQGYGSLHCLFREKHSNTSFPEPAGILVTNSHLLEMP